MKWEDLRRSRNVEDRRGQGGSFGGGMRRGGMGGGLGSILQLLLFMPGRGKWLILGLLLLVFLGGGNLFGGDNGGGLNDIFTPNEPESSQVERSQELPEQRQTDEQVSQDNRNTSQQQPGNAAEMTDAEFEFVSAVLASTEDFWGPMFEQEGETYKEPKLVVYEGGTDTGGCGFGSAQVGPFYCPADDTIYLDLSFWRQLSQDHGAPGDFAMAYVIAHEVGHHIQNELGIMDQYNQLRSQVGQREGNELNVRLELQADYLAGAWARYAHEQNLLEEGDLDEALQAAWAVGDDTIQEKSYGHVVPDSFTHGTAQQRQGWFKEGFEKADFAHANTFERYLDFEQ